MGFWSNLVGAGSEGITDAVSTIGGVVDKFVETPDEKTAAKIVFAKLEKEKSKFQFEINRLEAQHRSIFIASWRPYIGWICGVSLMFNFIVFPLMEWITILMDKQIPMPNINSGELMTLVISLLGLGAMRSWEKGKGVTK